MAKRLSSLFSSKDGEPPRSMSPPQLNTSLTPPQTPSRGKLTKPMTKSPADLHLNTRLSFDLEPPPAFGDERVSSRPGSRDGRTPLRGDTAGSRQSSGSRPQTPTLLSVPTTASPARDLSPSSRKVNKRRSWIGGKSDKQSTEHGSERPRTQAWIAGLRELVPYDITNLLNGEPVQDLWDDSGDVIVYLFPQNTMKGPSFRVHSHLFADSRALSYLTQPIHTGNGNQRTQQPPFDPSNPMAALSLQDRFGGPLPPSNGHPTDFSRPLYAIPKQQAKTVYLPLMLEGDYSMPGSVPTADDLELIVLYRNFFAFLCGGALVATQRQNTLYAIFMAISSILRRLQYGNEKGSSWGAVPWASFSRYTDELRLADVRASREKNIEAILLGNAMRSWPLYAEGFTHAAGRLNDIKSINSPKFDKISPGIVNRLERAAYDLQNARMLPLQAKLDNFYFPSMFAGVANSQTATESKLVRFKDWKAYFMDFRQYTMSQYKRRYGSWPPKASSKKNNFEESGLNRLVQREVFKDFTEMYELLVDRTSLTTRTTDMPTLADNAESGSSKTIQHALRIVESEYDRATPPVTPPIPFDVPLIPQFPSLMLAKDASNNRKLKDNELNDVLSASYNRDGMKGSQWLQDFIEYERRLCHGKTVEDLADVRCGQWLFMYAILQALPMTVVDARDLQYTEGVEYLLCQGPRGGRPWMQEDESTSRAWYNVASGGGLVSLPADVIDHSVEGIYRRSHCWTIATKWAEALGPISPVQPMPHAPFRSFEPTQSPLLASAVVPAASSPFGSPLLRPALIEDPNQGLPRISSRTSMNIGLQEVAPPPKTNRPVSQYNPNITFDNIIASKQIPQKSGKKGKK